MKSNAVRAFAAIFLLFASPLVAQQPKSMQLDLTNGWTHQQSEVAFPNKIADLPFYNSAQYVDGGWDISLQYGTTGLPDAVSIYIYQAAVQDVGLLFSESRNSLENRKDVYGEVKALAPPATFVPPGQSNASGLRITYNTTGKYPVTALAIAPLGREWVVKFRLSSTTRSAAELDTMMTMVIRELGWPADKEIHPVGMETQDCASILPKFEKARQRKSDGGNALINALFANGLPVEDDKPDNSDGRETKPVRYCRDRNVASQFGIYRPDDAINRYAMSLGDSGRAVFVEPDIGGLLLGGGNKKRADYVIRLVTPGWVETFPSFDRIPSPDQTLSVVENSAPVSRVGRGKGDKTINLDAGAFQ